MDSASSVPPAAEPAAAAAAAAAAAEPATAPAAAAPPPVVVPLNYKASVRNLPPFYSTPAIKQLLKKQQLEFKSVRLGYGDHATINFSTEAERDAAVRSLHGFWVKNRWKLRVQALSHDQQRKLPQPSKPDTVDKSIPVHERVADRVAPYRHMAYEEQLAKKTQWLRSTLNTLSRDLVTANVPWAKTGQRPCKVLACVGSPLLTGYRSKCDFTIGPAEDGTPNTIGFTLGSYTDGVVNVCEPTLSPVVSDNVKKVAACMQDFLRASGLSHYDRVHHTGAYRTFLVRSTTAGETMGLLVISTRNLDAERLQQLSTGLAEFWQAKKAEGTVRLDHLLVQEDNSVSGVTTADRPPPHVVFGEPDGAVMERLGNLSFRVSPDAFFQSNVPCAELLFDLAGQWADLAPRTEGEKVTLLDICCGTGTIGQVLASKVDSVIGFEIVESAVQDAKANAARNGITNVTYHVGKAEQTVNRALHGLGEVRAVGIVDPPRAGLHHSVIHAIRKCTKIQRLVYIACNLKQSKQNVVDFCRPTSQKWGGEPFRLIQAVPVDMFPHTEHCEVVLLLVRGEAELSRELANLGPDHGKTEDDEAEPQDEDAMDDDGEDAGSQNEADNVSQGGADDVPEAAEDGVENDAAGTTVAGGQSETTAVKHPSNPVGVDAAASATGSTDRNCVLQ